MADMHSRMKGTLAKCDRLRKEKEQLQHELEMALDSLKWTRDKLAEAQFENGRLRWVIVSAIEGGAELANHPR